MRPIVSSSRAPRHASRTTPSSSWVSCIELGTARHLADELLAGDVALRVVADHAAAVEEHEVVADRVGVMRVVRDEDHADAALGRLHDVAKHDARLLDAERRRRLVEDQHAGAEVDRARDRDRLPLAARQRADRLVGVADVDAHLRHLLARPSSSRRRYRSRLQGPSPSSAPRPGRSCARSTSAAPSPDPGRRSRSRVARVARRAEVHLRSLHQHAPLVVRVDAGEDLDKLDLPAPLSPRMHVTSPAFTCAETSFSATTLPKYFEICSSWSRERPWRSSCHLAVAARFRISVLSMTAMKRIPPWKKYIQFSPSCALMIPIGPCR